MNKRYTKVAIILHWLIAFGILGMFAFGWYMTGLPREAPEQMSYDVFDWGIYTWELTKESSPRAFYFNLHKSIGITLLGLIVIRILWRITHKPPALLTSYKAWERKLSTSAHHLLYLLMVLVPLSGLIMSVAGKYGVKWFGLDFIAGIENKPIREIFHETHEIAGLIFLAIIVLHILGALKHKFIDKDETMQRMLP
ncbi:MAG: cytochrome b [Betaproteobacteria bacterium]|nr:cytochrome b [Betaproteobacteria bacterium]